MYGTLANINYNKMILFVVSLFFLFTAKSQVNNLLSFETPGFYLMPSETGVHGNKWILASYMNSKKILSNLPIRSYAVSGDYQLLRGFQSLYVGGAVAKSDMVSSPYYESEFYGTLAYHRAFRKHTFHLGFQSGAIVRNLDEGTLLFPDQYDRNTGAFNPSITTNEPIDFTGKAINLNINLGLAYGLKIKKVYSKILLAYRNLNKPNVGLGREQLIVNPQLIVQNKTTFYLSNSDQINAFAMFRAMNEKVETYVGGEFVHSLMKHNHLMNEISAGSYIAIRSDNYPNNIVFNLGMGIQNFKLQLAYSYNFMNQGDKSDFNSFELVLLFKGLNKSLEQYKVPCEIY